MKRIAILLALPVLLFGGIACGGDDNDASPTATAVATSPAATATQPQATATRPASATPSGTALPPTDGTVAPQNAGDTVPFTIKSLPDPTTQIATLEDVRAGAHPESGGWDRIVFEFKDVRPAGIVEYVDSTSQCGSGQPVTDLPGSAILHVRFDAAQAHNDQGQLTIDGTEVTGPGNSILKAVSNCDFEGVVEWTIATSGKKNFKVTLLDNPTRVVIDVKW